MCEISVSFLNTTVKLWNGFNKTRDTWGREKHTLRARFKRHATRVFRPPFYSICQNYSLILRRSRSLAVTHSLPFPSDGPHSRPRSWRHDPERSPSDGEGRDYSPSNPKVELNVVVMRIQSMRRYLVRARDWNGKLMVSNYCVNKCIIIIRIFTQDNPSAHCTVINGVLHIELN